MPPPPSRPAASVAPKAGAAPIAPQANDAAPSGNKKKQKKRQNQAARRVAEQQIPLKPASDVVYSPSGSAFSPGLPVSQALDRGTRPYDLADDDEDDNYESREGEIFYSDEEGHNMPPPPPPPATAASKKKKKKKNKNRGTLLMEDSDPYDSQRMPGSFHPPPPPPPPLPAHDPMGAADRKMSRDRIWNTSTAEERERIKEFWLSLEENQRRSLVKVEKEAVLKKMKEQQRNSCSCTVCGRKRTAIEEELEVLYDAYYEELEQYANHQQIEDTSMHPPVSYPAASPPRLQYDPRLMSSSRPKGRIMEEIDEEEEEELYSDEDYGDEDSYEGEPRGSASDFFNFGNSLTVKGGILTVADDLLKNDGKKFIEMMEQLAERRMAREKAHTSRFDPSPLHPPLPGHDHPPLDDEEDYDDDDDIDYDDSQDDEYDEDMEAMSEEQRMEEGRRMFQIFAARMFEQRVLTAYREKVAKERQEKLLEELADESRLDAQREAKRAKEAQKKKDRKKQQKAAKDEEKQRRDAEKAAEVAAVKAAEEKKQEEARLKKEELRKKKEAEKKAAEEERFRKEAEKVRKAQELKDQQVEAERKLREQKEKEKKRREDAKRKEREEREAKEKEVREKKEREVADRREREAKAKADRDAKGRLKKEDNSRSTQPVPALPRKPSAVAAPIPPSLQSSTSGGVSPALPVATPAVPKSTSTARSRQASSQETHPVSPKPVSLQSGSSATSPGSVQHPPVAAPLSAKVPPTAATQQPLAHAFVPPIAPPPGMLQYPYAAPNGLPNPNYPASFGPSAPTGLSRGSPHDAPGFGHQQFGAPHRGYQSPAGLGFPPGINGMRGMPQGRGSPGDVPASQVPIGGGGGSSGWMPTTSHSRQASYEKHTFEQPGQAPGAISRPAPIQRPGSIPNQDEHKDIDELSSQLGSSALLDDMDDGPAMRMGDARNLAPGGHRPSQVAYGGPSAFGPPIGSAKLESFSPRQAQGAGGGWGAPQMPVNSLAMPNQSSWSAAAPGWGGPSQFGSIGAPGRAQSRPIALRLLACQAMRQLHVRGPVKSENGYYHVNDIVATIEHLRPANDPPVIKDELLDILDTEGNAQNGGGNFSFQNTAMGVYVKHEEDEGYGPRSGGAPGEIGSPVANTGMPFGRGFAPVTPSGF